MTEQERIDRFETSYNRIDRALTDITAQSGNRRKHSFAAKVRIAANRSRRIARHADFLLEIGELRNAVVHNRTGDELYLAVPSQRTVDELERIESQLFSPERVIPRFAREVLTLRSDQSLGEAWSLMRDDGYSRYPIYDNGSFAGLLTSNGFARWCAAHVNDGRLELDTTKVRVAEVVAMDHRRDAVAFVSSQALVDDVGRLFREKHPLEAVLITERGRPSEMPIGMVSPSDVAALDC